ncbi:hypothetical protein V6Z11_A05G360800 [Gossypium hirsutum]
MFARYWCAWREYGGCATLRRRGRGCWRVWRLGCCPVVPQRGRNPRILVPKMFRAIWAL